MMEKPHMHESFRKGGRDKHLFWGYLEVYIRRHLETPLKLPQKTPNGSVCRKIGDPQNHHFHGEFLFSYRFDDLFFSYSNLRQFAPKIQLFFVNKSHANNFILWRCFFFLRFCSPFPPKKTQHLQEEAPSSCMVLTEHAPVGSCGAILRLGALMGIPTVLLLGGMSSARRNKAQNGPVSPVKVAAKKKGMLYMLFIHIIYIIYILCYILNILFYI